MTNGIGIGFVASPEVDAKTAGDVIISTTDFNEEFFPVIAAIEVTESSGVILQGTISVGTNSPDYNNIVTLATLGTALSLTNILLSSVKVPASTNIRVKKITQSVATTHKFKVRVFGNLKTQL